MIAIQSRDLRPLDRYFPELRECAAAALLPDGCVLDGEIVIATPRGLDFDALQQRLHPAASRVAQAGGRNAGVVRRVRPARRRRREPRRRSRRQSAARALENAARRGEAAAAPDAGDARPRRGRAMARAVRRRRPRRRDGQADRRRLPARQAGDAEDQARAHRRLRRRRLSLAQETRGGTEAVGSLLLGLYDDAGVLQHVGVTSSFTMAKRRSSWSQELAPLREDALDDASRGAAGPSGRTARRRPTATAQRMPGATEPLERAARTCRGSRCDPSASARSSTTTCRATASATRRCSCAGAPTSRRQTAATTSSRSRTPYELEKVFGA